MKKRWFKPIPSVYLILLKGNRILLSWRYNTGFHDGEYGLPAGHLHGMDETLREAMSREAREEVDIEIDLASLELVHVMDRKEEEPADERRINFFFTVRGWDGEPRNMEPHKCDDLRWFELDDLPGNTIPYVREAINSSMKKISFSE